MPLRDLRSVTTGAVLLLAGSFALLLGWIGMRLTGPGFLPGALVLALVVLVLHPIGWGFLFASLGRRFLGERILLSGFGLLLLGLLTLPWILQPLESNRDIYLWQIFLLSPLFVYVPWITGLLSVAHGCLFAGMARRMGLHANGLLMAGGAAVLLVLGALSLILTLGWPHLLLPLFAAPAWGLAGAPLTGYGLASLGGHRALRQRSAEAPLPGASRPAETSSQGTSSGRIREGS